MHSMGTRICIQYGNEDMYIGMRLPLDYPSRLFLMTFHFQEVLQMVLPNGCG